MKKKTISDIRLYKSGSQNEYGIYNTEPFADNKLNAIVQRVDMKLRENEFSLCDFDHLYINFTTCDISEKMYLSDEVDKYHSWYRYCTIRIEKDIYDKLNFSESYEYIVQCISKVIVTYFSSQDFNETYILSCVQEALELGENMLMKFKEKVTTKRKAIIYLRFLDTCRFYPLLRVYDTEDNLLFEKDLPEATMLDYLGDIQISTKQVTIKPRKNSLAKYSAPLIFQY